MNQDFTVQEKGKIYLKKKFLHKQWAKKKFVQGENSTPPPPITFLMVPNVE